MEIKTYANPAFFRIALDDRLRKHATASRGLERLRQLVIYDRFLARIVLEFQNAVVLKGGLALELRLQAPRMTKDVDVRFSGDPQRLLERLQEAGRVDHRDFMTFEIVVDKDHPDIQGDGAKYDGKRFNVTCKIAGLQYGWRFGLDVGVGDPMIQEPEATMMPDRLSFIGVPPPRVRIYPIETHIAEKLHAYTQPRPPDRPNSRDKDLIDIALISTLDIPSSNTLRRAFEQTFKFRDTHVVPVVLPQPPNAWHGWYLQKVVEFNLEWKTLDACYERARRFLDPVLAGNHESTWDPASGEWL